MRELKSHQIHFRMSDHELNMLNEIREKDKSLHDALYERKQNMCETLRECLYLCHMIKCDDKYIIVPKPAEEKQEEPKKAKKTEKITFKNDKNHATITLRR